MSNAPGSWTSSGAWLAAVLNSTNGQVIRAFKDAGAMYNPPFTCTIYELTATLGPNDYLYIV